MEQQELPFEVRDMRHKEKFSIDDVYLNGFAKKCGIYATGVYVSLCRHADNKTQECWPSLKKIAEELNISLPMVQRAIKILEENRIIIKKRLGKKLNNRYVLLDKSEWSGISITMQQQTSHLCNSRPVHSKDTQLRYTHRKETSLKKKPYFWGNEMRFAQNKWWVIENGEWLEFAGRENQIEWK